MRRVGLREAMDAEEQPWPSTPYSGEFHLTALRTPGMVLRQGGFLPRHIAASCPPGKSKDNTRATSTSTRTSSSTTSSRRVGLGRHRSCQAGSRSAGKDLHQQSPLHSRRRGTEHVGASYRSPRPLSEETKERLRSARHRLLIEMSA